MARADERQREQGDQENKATTRVGGAEIEVVRVAHRARDVAVAEPLHVERARSAAREWMRTKRMPRNTPVVDAVAETRERHGGAGGDDERACGATTGMRRGGRGARTATAGAAAAHAMTASAASRRAASWSGASAVTIATAASVGAATTTGAAALRVRHNHTTSAHPSASQPERLCVRSSATASRTVAAPAAPRTAACGAEMPTSTGGRESTRSARWRWRSRAAGRAGSPASCRTTGREEIRRDGIGDEHNQPTDDRDDGTSCEDKRHEQHACDAADIDEVALDLEHRLRHAQRPARRDRGPADERDEKPAKGEPTVRDGKPVTQDEQQERQPEQRQRGPAPRGRRKAAVGDADRDDRCGDGERCRGAPQRFRPGGGGPEWALRIDADPCRHGLTQIAVTVNDSSDVPKFSTVATQPEPVPSVGDDSFTNWSTPLVRTPPPTTCLPAAHGTSPELIPDGVP